MNDIVIDTNVFVSSLRSSAGASYRLLQIVNDGFYQLHVSVPLVLEYEDAGKRQIGDKVKITSQQIDDIIDYLCLVGTHHQVYYLWRPMLRDPRDDMVLELAVASNSQYIVTYNISDFQGVELFGIHAITPKDLLKAWGVIA